MTTKLELLKNAAICLAIDMRLLQTGTWVPDEWSIQASLDNAEIIEIGMPTLLEAVELLQEVRKARATQDHEFDVDAWHRKVKALLESLQ